MKNAKLSTFEPQVADERLTVRIDPSAPRVCAGESITYDGFRPEPYQLNRNETGGFKDSKLPLLNSTADCDKIRLTVEIDGGVLYAQGRPGCFAAKAAPARAGEQEPASRLPLDRKA